jgi:ABC-type sugar transport system permease subunit
LESAAVDGAGPVSRFFHVTLPMVSPTLLFAFVVLTINAFQSFGQIDILTQGGPLKKTDVIVYSIFRDAIGAQGANPDLGTAAVKAIVLFMILLILTVVQFRFLERRVHYS